MTALAKLVSEGGGEHWTITVAGQDYQLISEAMFRAAARCPLKEAPTVGELAFDADEFLAIALDEAEAEGNA
ncbi:MAG: hypothetical protein ACFCVH_02335 [Alphaproteobacteria bacterium]